MAQKSILFDVITVFALIVVGYFFLTNRQEELLSTNDVSLSLTQQERQELTAVVFAEVNKKTNGAWDKKIEIQRINQSRNAAEGNWVMKDSWGWIAWRGVGGAWNVLVSLDGFDCEELASVPSQYDNFFRDSVYTPSGEEYCYAHASRTNAQ